MDPRISDKVQRFPEKPGVYIFTDGTGKALYVGKARKLRTRLRSYLRPGGDGRLRIRFLEQQARDVEFMVTATEQEALLLENTVIKQRKPVFNVKLKDDKSFLMLRLDRRELWPWFRLVRRRRDDGAEYFGPYASAKAVRRTLGLLHKVVPLRDCTDTVFRNRSRPCIKHQIGRCPAPCVGLIESEAYAALLEDAVRILQGEAGALLRGLQQEMQMAAAGLEFERAQSLKIQMQALGQVAESQNVVSSGLGDQDVLGIHRVGDEVSAVFLLYRSGRLEKNRRFSFRSQLPDELLLADLLGRYYEGDRYVPGLILLPGEVEEEELLRQWLSSKRGQRVEMLQPKRGPKYKNLQVATDNARFVDAVLADEVARRRKAVENLTGLLDLQEAPQVIHCLDVSTIQGQNTVGSRVCFKDGQPHKENYRRFALSAEASGDDLRAMAEIVRRSVTHCMRRDAEGLPDLMVVDGGRGQVAAALESLDTLGLREDLALVGLAKRRQSKEDVVKEERLFLPGASEPIMLMPAAPETLLLAAIRDEAHRFAITYHRKLRGKLTSELDDIKGLGPARRRLLLRHFGSMRKVRQASLEELQAVKGLPAALAESLFQSLQQD